MTMYLQEECCASDYRFLAQATEHAPVVDALLKAGGLYVGKTQMDELAYSLNGENVHYGTPVNPAAPGRIPVKEHHTSL